MKLTTIALLIAALFNLPIAAQTCSGGGCSGEACFGGGPPSYVVNWSVLGPSPDADYTDSQGLTYWRDYTGMAVQNNISAVLPTQSQPADVYIYLQNVAGIYSGTKPNMSVYVNGHWLYSAFLGCGGTPMDQDYILVPAADLVTSPPYNYQTVKLTFNNPNWHMVGNLPVGRSIFFYSAQFFLWGPPGAPPPGTHYHC